MMGDPACGHTLTTEHRLRASEHPPIEGVDSVFRFPACIMYGWSLESVIKAASLPGWWWACHHVDHTPAVAVDGGGISG